MAWSDAEFVAFLTQDAIPANEHWLVNLVSGLERQPDAAGCFGRHVAHDDAPWLIKQELERYFRALEQFPKALSIHTKPDRIRQKDQYWRKILHFYSDNNSCLRKSIWKEIPLPCIPFGEDQLWAEAIIRRGYTKVYAADAVVKHSHHYTAKETYNRARIEAEFYATCFGHSIHASRTGMDQAISRDCCDAVNRAIKAQDQCSAEHLAQQLECIIAKHCGGDPALRDTPQSKQASRDLRAVKVPKTSVALQSKFDVAMNMKEVFIKCCQAHQWPPIHINLDEHVQLDSTTIDAEAKAALSQGKPTLCLALIDLAKTFDLQSIEQLELKAFALQQLQGKATAATQGITTADATLQGLVNRLLQTCQQQQWPPQFLQADATASDPWETEKTILQEAEAARNADRTELSLHLIETTLEAGLDSPWFHHLKARALQKLEKCAEAIQIWEELSIEEIEGFSDTVRSSLKAARADQALAKARQQDASGALDAAIASLTSALLSDPDQKTVETSLKSMLRKRRQGDRAAQESSPLEDHQDELDLNQAVLLQAEQLLDSQEAVQGAG